MPKGDGPPPDQALPKLTLSQRILASLPNLQRDRGATAKGATAPARTSGGPRSATGTSAGTSTGPKRAASSEGRGEVLRPDAVIGAPGGTGGSSGNGATAAGGAGGTRLRDAFTKPAPGTASRPDAYKDTSTEDLRHAMKYLDERERRFPLVIGPLLAILDIALTLVTLHDNPAVGHKNHVDPSSIVALGVGSAVVALLVVVAAFYRRRSFTIFALLFAGYGGGFVTMIPAWFVAGWLFVRFNRMQKVVVARTGGPAAARQRASRARAERSPRPRLGRKDKTPPPVGPAPNKRYTPPKPASGGR